MRTASHRMRWFNPAHRVWPGLRAGQAEPQAARPAWLGDRRAQPGVREVGIWLPPPPKLVLSSWPVGTLPQQRSSRHKPAGVGERRVDPRAVRGRDRKGRKRACEMAGHTGRQRAQPHGHLPRLHVPRWRLTDSPFLRPRPVR